MYCVYDDEGHIIAYHEKKKVVTTYIDRIFRFHQIMLDYKKIKSEYEDILLKGKEDLYLVRYADTYVQSGYLVYLQIVSDQVNYDHEYAKDVLCRILETAQLSKKDTKVLEKSIDILDKIIYEEAAYTPTIKELQRYKYDYDPYFYNAKMY